MARKITVSFNGKVIGTRRTDRIYTHALVLVDFDPVVYRARRERDWRAYGEANHRSSHRHALEVAKGPSYKYASVVSPSERVNCERIAAMPIDDYITERRVDFIKATEKHIAEQISKGTQVLSYHGSRDLAFKAQAQARKVHDEFLVLVEPVDGGGGVQHEALHPHPGRPLAGRQGPPPGGRARCLHRRAEPAQARRAARAGGADPGALTFAQHFSVCYSALR